MLGFRLTTILTACTTLGQAQWKKEPGSIGCATSCPDPSCVCLAGNASHGCRGSSTEQCYWSSVEEAEKFCGAWSDCAGFHTMKIVSDKWYASAACGLQCLQGPYDIAGWIRWLKEPAPAPPSPSPPSPSPPSPLPPGMTGISLSGFSSGACMAQIHFLHYYDQADGLGYNGCVNMGAKYAPGGNPGKLKGKGVHISDGMYDSRYDKVKGGVADWKDVVGQDRVQTLWPPTGHSWPTAALGGPQDPCDKSKPIQNCKGIDLAGDILRNIYPTLKAPTDPHDNTGTFYWLDQSAYVPNGDITKAAVWSKAAVFKPHTCADASKCMLHVHYHGCGMRPGSGWKVHLHSGLNAWGIANNIVVIYPSAPNCWMSKWDCFQSNPGADEQVCQVQQKMVQKMMTDVQSNKAKLAPMSLRTLENTSSASPPAFV